ncbi:MAG: tRNA-dihydrouridine synthase B [Halioglobus sp.]|jgi:tRNA-dihydrouridine synthase B
MLQIGPFTLPNRVALAPMAGITDLPFRKLCSEFGAGLVVSEMISSQSNLRDSRKTILRSRHDDEIAPRSVQIAGNDPQQMAEAARYNVERGAQIIDINMGCPAKKVCRKAAGSALLADEALVKSILNTVVGAVDVPVTLKIRTGASPAARNGITIARIAEDAGIAALAVHGRTRACAFTGQVEYHTISEIVAATDFPVFANGDIDSPKAAANVLAATGAAGVMIGRAAQGRPWLCGQIATYLETGVTPDEPGQIEQLSILHRHVQQLHQFYGEFMGVRIARKHVAWYLANRSDVTTQRRLFNQLDFPAQQLHYIDTLAKHIGEPLAVGEPLIIKDTISTSRHYKELAA